MLHRPVGSITVGCRVIFFFVTYAAAQTHNALQWAGQLPITLKLPLRVKGSRPHLIQPAWSSSGGVTQSKGERAVLGVFFPTDNALYSISFGTHTKTAEPIKMPFGLMTRVVATYHVLDGDSLPLGGSDPPRGRGNFGGCAGHSKAFSIFAAAVVAASLSRSLQQGSFNRQ